MGTRLLEHGTVVTVDGEGTSLPADEARWSKRTRNGHAIWSSDGTPESGHPDLWGAAGTRYPTHVRNPRYTGPVACERLILAPRWFDLWRILAYY
jgi:hypothetical protein